MLRFIIKRHQGDAYSGLNETAFFTVDADVPELEAMLTRGGMGGPSFDAYTLTGVEILRVESAESATLPEKRCSECEGSGEILLPIPDGPDKGEMFTRECPRGCVREKPATCKRCRGAREIVVGNYGLPGDSLPETKPCPDCAGARA